jgi:hypothetical protein
MAGRSNLEELLYVLENIRKEKHPNIPSEVIQKIVKAQYDNQDKRLEARALTASIVAEFLNTVATESEGN